MTDETNELEQTEGEMSLKDVVEPGTDSTADDDEEFDTLFSVGLRASLDAAGPSFATEDRIFANLMAARGLAFDADLANGAAPVEDVSSELVDASAPSLETPAVVTAAQPVEAVAEAPASEDKTEEPLQPTRPAQPIDPSTTAPVPIIEVTAESAAGADGSAQWETPSPEETAPSMHVVRGGIAREASETSDLAGARTAKGSFLGRRISRRATITAIAASIVAFVLVIGISSLKFGQAPNQADSKVSSEAVEEAASTDDAAMYEDSSEETAVSTESIQEDAAATNADAGSAATTAEGSAQSEGDGSTEPANGAEGTDKAQHEPTLAEVYTSILISHGGKLIIVVDESGPETVDPTSLGEFMEEAKATDGSKSVRCEVYHIIAQSDGDSVLYAVRYENDGTFYLAKSV